MTDLRLARPGSPPPAQHGPDRDEPVPDRARSGRPAAVAGLARREGTSVVIAVVIGVATWPFAIKAIAPGLDNSWGAALHVARRLGLDYGTQLAFTHGPLGFLAVPRPYDGTGFALSALTLGLVHIAACYTFVRVLRRAFPLPVAALLAGVGGATLSATLLGRFDTFLPGTVAALLAALWGLRRMTGPPHLGTRPAAVATLGALAPVFLLLKVDGGVVFTVSAMGAVVGVAGFAGGVRAAAAAAARFAAGGAVTGTVLWVLLDQSLGDLPLYGRRAIQVAAGYGAAMGYEEAGREWEYPAALVVALVVFGSTWAASRGRAGGPRLFVLGYVAALLFLLFKQGFTRHDVHSIQYFAGAALLTLAFLRREVREQVLLALVACLVAVLAVLGVAADRMLDVPANVAGFRRTLELAVDSGRRHLVQQQEQLAVRAAYAVPADFVERMRGQTVHVEPTEATVAWAYPEIVWDPTPVFQSYSAYTPGLDRANASFLRSARAPRFVLRQPAVTIDGRLGRWDSPEANLAMLCRYREVGLDGGWQLLERVADRCGPARSLGARTARLGRPVVVPAAEGELVVARFHGVGGGAGDALQALLSKPDRWYLGDATPTWFTFLSVNQGQPHLLSVPPCVLRQLDGPSTPDLRQVVLSDRPGPPGRSAAYRVELQAVPLSC